MQGLTLHAGARSVTEAEVAAVDLPEPTATYCPVPHAELIGKVREHLKFLNIRETDSNFALQNEGKKMFGVIHTDYTGGSISDVSLAIGLRNSYDRSLAAMLLAGQRVWICDNLAYSADVVETRKHTSKVWDDMGYMIFTMMDRVLKQYPEDTKTLDKMKNHLIGRGLADHILLEAVRQRAVPFTKMALVDEIFTKGEVTVRPTSTITFDEAFPEQTLWRLFNAFTHAYKGRHPAQVQEESKRLFKLFRGFANDN